MRLFYLFALSGAITLSALTPSHAAQSAERRCGWFENPTPANATLTDRNGTWEIASQGGYQAEGEWPEFDATRWIRTGYGNYGYGCACVTAVTDPHTHRMNKLEKATARPLEVCRKDRALKEPEDPLSEIRQMVRYQDKDFSFSYPKAWSVKKENQCLSLNRPNSLTEEEYTLQICVQHGTLQQAADSMIFYNDKDTWIREAGMDEPSPVDIIEGSGWKGMQTTQTCGVSDAETGFHAAGEPVLWALSITRKRNCSSIPWVFIRTLRSSIPSSSR